MWDIDISIIDIEFTLDRRIYEIGIVKLHNWQNVDEFSAYVDPGTYNIWNADVDVSQLRDSPKLVDIWDDFEKFNSDSAFFLCSSASADMNALMQDTVRYNLDCTNRKYIDNVVMAKRIKPGIEGGYGVQNLCKHFSTDVRPDHTALTDAYALTCLYYEETLYARGMGLEELCQSGIRTYRKA